MPAWLATTVEETPLASDAYKALQGAIYGDFGLYFMPEAILLLVVLVMLLMGMRRGMSEQRGIFHALAAGTILVAFAICLRQIWTEPTAIFRDWGNLANQPGVGDYLGAMLAGDGLAHFFRLFLLFTGLLTVWMASCAKEMNDRSPGEFYALFLGSLVGMMLLVSASHVLMVYLAIEMMSLPSYVMVALRRKQRRATEASLKYMLFGSVASGAMIYGLSLIYGLTGGLSFATIGANIAHVQDTATLGIGLFLVVIGIGYKMAIAPMHFWCPDAYEGAPTPVTAFLSVASKAAGFALAARFIYIAAGSGAAGASALPWVEFLAVLSVLTMTVGNVTAIWQNNIKRMLAYSSIAQAGYLMMGIVAMAAGRVVGGEQGEALAQGSLFAIALFLVAYLLTNYGAFGVVIALENQDNDNENLTVFRGLARRNLLLSICMFVLLLGLLGVPPTVGFFGKLWLFRVGVDASAGNPLVMAMLVAAAINTAISCYYYFRVARAMFLDIPERGTYRPFIMPAATRVLVGMLAGASMIFFIFIDGLVDDLRARLPNENSVMDGRGVAGEMPHVPVTGGGFATDVHGKLATEAMTHSGGQ